VPGAKGWAEVVVNKYKNRDGEDRQNNRVGKYLDPAEVKQAPTAAPAGGGFVPGAF
jgi:hypothetical protein